MMGIIVVYLRRAFSSEPLDGISVLGEISWSVLRGVSKVFRNPTLPSGTLPYIR